MAWSRGGDAHILGYDRVVLDDTARRAKDNDATVRRVRDHIVSDEAVGTTETDAVSPLLELIGAAGADVVELNGNIRATECAFCDVEAGP